MSVFERIDGVVHPGVKRLEDVNPCTRVTVSGIFERKISEASLDERKVFDLGKELVLRWLQVDIEMDSSLQPV